MNHPTEALCTPSTQRVRPDTTTGARESVSVNTNARRTLTEGQARVLRSVVSYYRKHQIAPTIHEIGRDLGISKPTTYEHLRRLTEKGFLSHEGRHRSRGRVPTRRAMNWTKRRAMTELDGVWFMASLEDQARWANERKEELLALLA